MELRVGTDYPSVIQGGVARAADAAARVAASEADEHTTERWPIPKGDEKLAYTAAARTRGRATVHIEDGIATITREKPGGFVKFYNNLNTLRRRRATRDKWLSRITLGIVRRKR